MTYFRRLHDIGEHVSLSLGASKVLEYQGRLEIIYHNFYHHRSNAVMSSYEFTIISGEKVERLHVAPKKFFDHSIHNLSVPLSFESFYVQVPNIEVNGVLYEIPLVEFRKTIGERRKESAISCW